MAVYYKFKSAKDFDSIPIDGHFISVANLKERIFEVKHLGRGTDFDLMVSNAQTNEEYADEAMLIPKNTSVLIRRVPGRPRKPIVAAQEEQKVEGNMLVDVPSKSNMSVAEMSATRIVEEPEWDEFGNDLYDIPEALPVQSAIPVLNMSPPNIVEEENKIKAFVDTSALDWQRQIQENVVAGRGYGRGMGGRMMAGRGIGRGIGGGGGAGGMMRKTPPQGYVCHRCNIPGHFIQHCPTNGDPNYDIKRVKPPTGIPKSMLIATPDGSYALPSGAVAVMKPNEAAFEREIEGLPSARPVTDFPPELRCPLCNDVMKDAVLTSKCCFSSFCDKCIRDYIISKSMCVCGATNILADDLVPNKTVRVTINHILEATTSSADNAGSMQQLQDMESARPGIIKAPSPTQSATSKEGSKGILLGKEPEDEANGSAAVAAGQLVLAMPPPELKEQTSQESALAPGEEASEKVMSSDLGKKKKKKKARLAGEMQQWSRGYPEMENYSGMMPLGGPFNPVFPGAMPWGMDGFLGPIPGHSLMGYPPHGPFDIPSYPYAPGLLMPPPLLPPQQQLDLPEMSGPNGLPAGMSRNEADKRKEELRWRARESERRHERGHSRDMDMEKDKDSFLRSRHRTEDRGERSGRSSGSRGLSADRAERTRSSRTDRDEKSSRVSGSDRPEKSSRTSASDRPEKSSQTNDSDRPEKSSRANASDRPEKSNRTSGSDRPEKSSRSSGSERPEKSTRTSGSDRGEKSSREDHQGEKSTRSSGSDRGEKSSREDHQGEKSTRSSGSDRGKKSSREDHQQKKQDEQVEVLPPPPPLPASMAALPAGDRKQKGSVFSRISFPESGKKRRTSEEERNKSGKGSSSSSVAGTGLRSGASEERESDEDYHFKRRPTVIRPENEGEDARKGSSSKSSSTRDRDRRSAKRR